MKRELICIGCPMGCHLTAEIENGVVTRVTGNTCRRGEDYAKKECVAPMRTVTGTVALRGGRLPVLPVRTNGEVPKEKVLAVAEALRSAVALGNAREVAFREKGEIVFKTCLPLGVVMDERICSGHYFASAFQNMKRYFSNPSLLEMSPEEEKAFEEKLKEEKEEKANDPMEVSSGEVLVTRGI